MILPRYYLDSLLLPTSTPGSWYDTDHKTLICKTLELPYRGNAISNDPNLASCINAGIYLFVWQQPGHGRNYEYFRCVHAPGRHWHPDTRMSSILVHTANKVEHLLGCIAPGSRHVDMDNDGDVDVIDSTKKLLWMTRNLPRAFELAIDRKNP